MGIQRISSSTGGTRVTLLAVASLAVVALGWHLVRGSAAVAAPAHGKEGADGVVVESSLARRADVPVYLDGLGTTQAFYTARITSRVDGQLQDIVFTEGQPVHKGGVLARIDPRPYQAAFDQANAAR